jgi:osmotically-inducible protein OsmY
VKALWCLPLLCALVVGCSERDTDKLEHDATSAANDADKAAQSIAHDAGKAAAGLGLQASVHTVLWLRKGVDTDDLHVEAKDGTVTLTGHVKDSAMKRLIEDTVIGIKGVDMIDDKLEISH